MPTFRPPLYRQLCQLAWPLILSNLCIPLLGLIDTALLGSLASPIYLAAAAIGASLTVLIVSSFNFLRMTSTGLSAQAFGNRNSAASQQQSAQDLYQGLAIALVIGGLIALSSQLLAQLGLKIMGIAGEHLALAQQYAEIRLLAAPASLMSFVLIGFAIGRQQSRLALIILFANCSINALADYLLIITFNLNSQGAAIASVIAEYSALFLALFLCWRGFPFLRHHTVSMNTFAQLKRHWQLNGYLLIRSLCLLSVFASFTALAENYGSYVVACNAVLMQLVLLQSYLLDGFANATESKVGEAAGMQNKTLLIAVLKASGILSLICAIVLTLSLWVLSPIIATSFSTNAEVIALINEHLLWIIALPLITVWAYWLDGVAVGLTAAKTMRNSIVIAALLVYIPACYFLLFLWPANNIANANHGLWLAFILFSVARAIGLLPLLNLKPKNI